MTENILDYGAIADGSSDEYQAIQAAIDSCGQRGGGMVLVPAGHFIGPLHMRSHVELHPAPVRCCRPTTTSSNGR